jgi:hypothetical protein
VLMDDYPAISGSACRVLTGGPGPGTGMEILATGYVCGDLALEFHFWILNVLMYCSDAIH